MSVDTLTVLCARSGMLAKQLAARDGGWQVRGYAAGKWFGVEGVPVEDPETLGRTLEQLTRDPRRCVIRGAPVPGIDLERCRRLSNRAEHGDAVTFEPCARWWLALDVDDVPEPPGLHFASEPEAGIEHVLDLMPEPFGDTSCWWQATGSAGVKPGLRCRLWFWCSRQVADEEAKGWLARSPIDKSLYSPVQPHYVAAPVLLSGVHDPVVRRSGRRTGLADVLEIPAELPRVEQVEVAPVELAWHELSAAERRRLARVLARARVATAIWRGERRYPDRSTRHFAFAAALIRAGLNRSTDHDLIAAALMALDVRLGAPAGKVNRPDYLARTIAAAMARAAA
jgi:hypothetical protein